MVVARAVAAVGRRPEPHLRAVVSDVLQRRRLGESGDDAMAVSALFSRLLSLGCIQLYSMFDVAKRNVLKKLKEAVDKSPKGSLDAPIVDLIHFVNEQADYVTTSSCSGRIAAFAWMEPSKEGGTGDVGSSATVKGGGEWLLAEHAHINLPQLRAALSSDKVAGRSVILKHEPFIMHVQCRTVEAAQRLLQTAMASGFRESGLSAGKKTMVAVRTTAGLLEIPLIACGRLLVSEEYLRYVLEVANDKFTTNERRTERFFAAVRKSLQAATPEHAKDEASRREQARHSAKRTHRSSEKGESMGPSRKQPEGIVSKARCSSDAAVTEPTAAAAATAPPQPQGARACLQRWGAALAHVISGRYAVLCGGFGGDGAAARLNDVLVRDNATMEWFVPDVCPRPDDRRAAVPAVRPAAPAPRVRHTLTGVASDVCVLFGGRTSPARSLSDVWCLTVVPKDDGVATTWHESSSASGTRASARWAHSATWIGNSVEADDSLRNSVIVFGGRSSEGVLGDLWALRVDQSTGGAPRDSWTRLATRGRAPSPVFAHAAALCPAGLIVHGGFKHAHAPPDASVPRDADGSDLDEAVPAGTTGGCEQMFSGTMTVLDLVELTWSHPEVSPSPSALRASHTLSPIPGCSRLLILGGARAQSDTAAHSVAVMLDSTQNRYGKLEFSTSNLEIEADGVFPVKHCASVDRTRGGIMLSVLGGGGPAFPFGQYFGESITLKIAGLADANVEIASADVERVAVQSLTPKPAQEVDSVVSETRALLAERRNVKLLKTALEQRKWYDNKRRIQPWGSKADGVMAIPLSSDGASTITSPETESSSVELLRVSGALFDDSGGGVRIVDVSLPPSRAAQARTAQGSGKVGQLALELARVAAEHGLPADVTQDAPRKVEWVGDIAVIPAEALLDPRWEPAVPNIWDTVASVFGCQRVARAARIDAGLRRRSRVELLKAATSSAGDEEAGWVTVRENGLKYSFDITRVMFSSGNVTEKARMGRLKAAGETVVDLYCGIGYFTIPLLVHAKVRHVHACDWNSDAIVAIRRNLVSNGVAERCTVHYGDNAQVAQPLADVADRVLLGLIPTSAQGWPVAVSVLRRSGGWLHVHDNVHEKDIAFWTAHVANTLVHLAAAQGKHYTARCVHLERVKSYAPRVFHVVGDFHLVAVETACDGADGASCGAASTVMPASLATGTGARLLRSQWAEGAASASILCPPVKTVCSNGRK